METMLTKKEVLDKLYHQWQPERKTVIIPISEAAGRVVSKNVYSLIRYQYAELQ